MNADRPAHREADYPEALSLVLFETLRDHFWVFGRNDAILLACRRWLPKRGTPLPQRGTRPSLLDLGGGWGSFARSAWQSGLFGRVALADTSEVAVRLARDYLPPAVEVHHADADPGRWNSRWDVLSLLDTLEHVEDDGELLRSASRLVEPGGLLVVTVPAGKRLWSMNDVMIGHKRRYTEGELRELGRVSGLEVLEIRALFRFLLPAHFLHFAHRGPPSETACPPETVLRRVRETHAPPPRGLNAFLKGVSWLENRCVGLLDPFPWGTSVLGVFRRRG